MNARFKYESVARSLGVSAPTVVSLAMLYLVSVSGFSKLLRRKSELFS